MRGQPVITAVPANARFVERRAGARSLRNFFSANGPRRRVMVAVTDEAVVIRSEFPASLWGGDFSTDDGTIPLGNVIHVAERGVGNRPRWSRYLEVEFSTGDGQEVTQLFLRNREQFLTALRASGKMPKDWEERPRTSLGGS